MDKPLYIYLSVYKEVSLKCLTFDTQKKNSKNKNSQQNFFSVKILKSIFNLFEDLHGVGYCTYTEN